jgi:hypothetical protein
MIGRHTTFLVVIGASLVSNALLVADETPTPPSNTTPGTTPSTTNTTTQKNKATNIITGKVDKISNTSITLKATIQTVVSKPTAKNPKGKVKTTTQTMTFEIGEVPPVKIVTDGSKPTRTTGSFSDVKVGDMVEIGTSPVKTTTSDGKATSHTQVTGIDVLKHLGASSTTKTTTTTPANK